MATKVPDFLGSATLARVESGSNSPSDNRYRQSDAVETGDFQHQNLTVKLGW
jgi:hypothetical protein